MRIALLIVFSLLLSACEKTVQEARLGGNAPEPAQVAVKN